VDVITGIGGPSGPSFATLAEKYGLKIELPVHFQPCRYCQRAPDKGQKEANCRGCGAGLTEVDKKVDDHERI